MQQSSTQRHSHCIPGDTNSGCEGHSLSPQCHHCVACHPISVSYLHIEEISGGVLCNPNFAYKRIIGILIQDLSCSNKGSLYFLYPLTSLPKMVKWEVLTSVMQIKPCVGPPLLSVINKKGNTC